ncbi:hypothetical protein K2173_013219 [Erythroxylum novogranatense]|uniref:IST1-like protein n=1 Tax=Erythroxylum novogranatense TaxID=1862640 RepID=A0AAV8SC68_9ROSI|nr:hypothetical protein K2173_013219 [Erythroxylum novogranatense]
MLDGLLGRGYTSKCKSLIKLTKSRIDVIRRKRNATLKFLRKDIADLLAHGLDINAYGRAEGLMAEMILSSCYDFVEHCCDFVLKHLSVMQKMSHCPEDCREAVSSLMVAAARFSDLPELRDLRNIFVERYGDSVDLFADQKFQENLFPKSFMMENKVELMQDIASEFSINWDSRGFSQTMSGPSASAQDKPKTFGSLCTNDDKHSSSKYDFSSKERPVHINDGNRLFNDGPNPRLINEVPSNECKEPSVKKGTMLSKDKKDSVFQEKHEARLHKHEIWKDDSPIEILRLGGSSSKKKMQRVDNGSKIHEERENSMPKRDRQDMLTRGQADSIPRPGGMWLKNGEKETMTSNGYVELHKNTNSIGDVREEEMQKLKSPYRKALPPPYTKPNTKFKEGKYGATFGSLPTGSDGNVVDDPLRDNRSNAGNGSEKIQEQVYRNEHEKQSVGFTRECGPGHDRMDYYQDDSVHNPIPKPRSSRRRQPKLYSNVDDGSNLEDAGVVKRRSRSRRKDDSKRGLQILVDEHHHDDEEERVIDRLLIHYSKKPSAYESEKVRRKSRNRRTNNQGSEDDRSRQHVGRDGPDEMVPHQPRSISLPQTQTSSEATKVFTRAASFQSDGSNPARHVHPKLPDYDDLAARFAALKSR